MLKIFISNPFKYPINERLIVGNLTNFLRNKVQDDCEVSIRITGYSEMLNLARKYLFEPNNLHNVLSFAYSEVRDFLPDPDGINRLGDIVVCYEKAKDEAKAANKSLDEWLYYLIEHGAKHLLGIHHD
ncbi:MAG: rRNA maturation RNase YbeY [Patescibacteria group bacterium]|nr:rRNA maturation RNase YbeY [Patescibacteria group bacterium]